MDTPNIACFDVYYHEGSAKASCIVFKIEPQETILSHYNKIITPVSEYIPGEFYKRELPCLLGVYGEIKEKIDLAIVDGFVFLEKGKKGLGEYLYEALGERIPVMGVAKTFYKGCQNYLRVYRGNSNKPLFVSSIGVEQNYAADLIKTLAGANRIPAVLKMVDRLSRSNVNF